MKKRTKSHFMFLLFILCVCIIIFGVYFIVKRELIPSDIIEGLTNSDGVVIDNYNGVYEYRNDLNGSKSVSVRCNISYISDLILIFNDTFYLYRSSCMGTYLKESGKTKDLEIKENNESETLFINYKGKRYDKNYSITSIVPNNDIKNQLSNINLNTYQLIVKETEFEGNYYDIYSNISNISSNIKLNFKHIENGTFNLSLDIKADSLYSLTVNNFDYLPDLFPYGKNVVIIEKNKTLGDNIKFKYNFKVVDEKGTVYNLYDYFPIVVDDVTLNQDNSIFIMFDYEKRVFRMLMGYDDKMCVTDDKSDDVIYYEFEIDYNYATNKFDKPLFIKKGTKSEGCAYVDKVMGR